MIINGEFLVHSLTQNKPTLSPYSLKYTPKLKNFNPVFLDTDEIFFIICLCRSNHDGKDLNLIHHSAHSEDYLWFLISRGKQKKRKN